jgi:hypothetical protein
MTNVSRWPDSSGLAQCVPFNQRKQRWLPEIVCFESNQLGYGTTHSGRGLS